MSNNAVRQPENSRFLAAALDWLQLCLLQRIGEQVGDSRAADAESPKGWRRRESRATSTQPQKVTAADLDRAREAMAAAEDPTHPFLQLCQTFDLLPIERETLLLCVAIELEPRLAALCEAASDGSLPYPTFALALRLFDDKAWNFILPQRPLRYWNLLEVHQPADRTLTTSCLRADERIVGHVLGLPGIDQRLNSLCRPLAIDPQFADVMQDQAAAVEGLILQIQRASAAGRVPVVQLTDSDAVGKQFAAQQVAAAFGRNLWRIAPRDLPLHAAERESLARIWTRETLLAPAALFVDDDGDSVSDDGQRASVKSWLDQVGGLVFLATSQPWPGLATDCLTIEVLKPTPPRQRAAWRAFLGRPAGETPDHLAGQFNLNLADIQHIARQAEFVGDPVERMGSESDKPADGAPENVSLGAASAQRESALHPRHKQLWDACRDRTRPESNTLIQRIRPVAEPGDLVLPAGSRRLLDQIVGQVRHRSRVYDDWHFRDKMSRGLGISVLFTGESGTGKTMAAEVIARQLELDLYRVDLSAVVNKYIGETEKNLRRVFDAAEDGGAVLFFDEADALFGRRSEVKDSHDRYANIEINYLLQRMESYRGLAILATNMKKSLDKAFLRRLRFIVEFPLPGQNERREIWQRVFPRAEFLQSLDVDRLAGLNLTGGNIHNIALNAAFLAAATGDPRITMAQVLESARDEYRKLDRPINESEFVYEGNGHSRA